MPKIQREPLSPDIEQRLRDLGAHADIAVRRRAQLILRWYDGATQSEIAAEVGLSTSNVAHWLKQFRERGMALFETAEMPGAATTPEPVAEPVPEAAVTASPEPVTTAASMPASVPPKPRRGRGTKAEPMPLSDQTEPTVHPIPEPAGEVIAAEPPAVPEPTTAVETAPEPAVSPAKTRRGR